MGANARTIRVFGGIGGSPTARLNTSGVKFTPELLMSDASPRFLAFNIMIPFPQIDGSSVLTRR